ncbi:MAG: hypothetical protein AB9880_01245 [Christensenellales bacterium]
MKKLLILTLCLLLLCEGALAQVRKTEVVYARLDAAGALQGVYIVNSFETDTPAQILDYGQYLRLINLSGTDQLGSQPEGLSLSLQPGRFYYQGDPVRQALPWDIRLSYRLDGAAVQPGTLSGARGRLEIGLEVAVNEALAAYAEGLTLQISLTLDGDKCLDILAPGASIASAGGKRTLAYVILPGQPATYTASAKVQDFSMPGLQIVGLRLVMDAAQYQAAATKSMAGSPLAAAAGPLIGNFLTTLSGAAPLSFADSRNGAVESLQFVIMTDEIPAAPRTQVSAETEEAPQTILTRFLALFGG